MKKFKRALIIFILIVLSLTSNFTVFADEKEEYYIGGFPLGFDLSGQGALIVGITEVICSDGIYTPAKDAGLNTGDYILTLNGNKITTASDIDNVLSNYKKGELIAEILTNGEKNIINVVPKKDLSGRYKIGVLIRDYVSGIGTVTLISPNGNFASLGHPVSDEKGNLLGVGGGKIFACNIIGVIKGSRGQAGELKGNIIRIKEVGIIYKNCNIGLLGKINDISDFKKSELFQIGEAELGNAEIYTTINGSFPEKYKICIVKIDSNEKNNKNMVIKITDEKLIKSAGGIVQGMSGSPIVQNGKIVGAVTHVFLNDSTRGYAIQIDKMISELNG